jgi:hypothetical protein
MIKVDGILARDLSVVLAVCFGANERMSLGVRWRVGPGHSAAAQIRGCEPIRLGIAYPDYPALSPSANASFCVVHY